MIVNQAIVMSQNAPATTTTTTTITNKEIIPQKKSFVAAEENIANENIVITYEIID